MLLGQSNIIKFEEGRRTTFVGEPVGVLEGLLDGFWNEVRDLLSLLLDQIYLRMPRKTTYANGRRGCLKAELRSSREIVPCHKKLVDSGRMLTWPNAQLYVQQMAYVRPSVPATGPLAGVL